MPPTAQDQRTAATVVRQYEHIAKIKRDLAKQGLLNGDATPHDVIEKLRTLIPPDLWAAK